MLSWYLLTVNGSKINSAHLRCARRLIGTSAICQSHYNTLGITSKATRGEIKKAYLQKCQQFHPDKHPNNPTMHEKFVKVNEAYQVLSNQSSRLTYDNAYAPSRYSRQQHPGGFRYSTQENSQGFGSNPFENQQSKRAQSGPEDIFKAYQRNRKYQHYNQHHYQHHARTVNSKRSRNPFEEERLRYSKERIKQQQATRHSLQTLYVMAAIMLYITTIVAAKNRRELSQSASERTSRAGRVTVVPEGFPVESLRPGLLGEKPRKTDEEKVDH